MTSCELNQIFLGEVASVQNYGAFVRIPGCKQQGLIHKSQVSSARVDDVADVLQRGERVWCKVINIGDDGKVGLSMKHVNQGNGKDLDPTGVEQQQDEQRRKKVGMGGQKKAIELEAIFNTTCSKCGTRGHMAADCFATPDGKKYELIPEIEEALEAPKIMDEKSEKPEKAGKKLKKRKKSKKSKQCDNDSSEDSDDSDSNDNSTASSKKHKRKKKKRSKDGKKKKRKHSSDDSDSSDSPRETKYRREGNDKKSKKCKHSRTKYSD